MQRRTWRLCLDGGGRACWTADSPCVQPTQSCVAALQELQERRIELGCFKALHGNESIAAPQRLSELRALVDEQKEREQTLQQRYAEVTK